MKTARNLVDALAMLFLESSTARCDIAEKPGFAADLIVDHTLHPRHSGWRKVWFRTPADNPIHHLSRTLRFRFPRQAFLRVGHALPAEAEEKLPITCKFAQYLFDLCYYITSFVAGIL